MIAAHSTRGAADMTKQDETIRNLERKGWRFANWISAHDPADESAQCAVMVKRPTRFRTEYCEVNPDGTVA
jgi:hypothetical protein